MEEALPTKDYYFKHGATNWLVFFFLLNPWHYWPLQSVLNKYHKILKISPPKYQPPKSVTQKNPPLNCPSKYKPTGDLHMENFPQTQSKKKSKNSKFTSNYKASPIDFET